MIIDKDKGYATNDLITDKDFSGGNALFVIDETKEENKELVQKIITNAPYIDFITDKEGNLVDVIPTERPEPEPIIQEPTIDERISAIENVLLMLL